MERHDGGAPLPDALRGGAVALGNFDGFHAGHAAVVGRAVAWARARGRPALVGTFDPHPALWFKPETPPMALTRLDQRLELFAAAGADATIVWRFDAALAARTAEGFMAEDLARAADAAHVVTGWDFTFGARRGGGPALLDAAGPALGFTADALGPVTEGAEPISSTRVRDALRTADPATATALMGRPFTIRGVVEHGAKLGRTLGFPTANLRLGGYLRPAYGVYAVRVRTPDGVWRAGVANLGVRPMIEPPLELLEATVLDWSGDLYGHEIDVALIAYLRPEWKLDGLDALKAQVERDKHAAREVLTSN